MDSSVRLSLAEAETLCISAAKAAGASHETAAAIAKASVRAEAEGQPNVGLAHFLDYLDSLRHGRIDGKAEPRVSRPAEAIIVSDACRGAAHTGFDRAFGDLVARARRLGLCLFLQRNAFTCGALGHFAVRLAEAGLVGLAATNGPALLAGSGTTKPVFCTNPLAFAAPVEGAAPLLIDQASSATAFVSIRQAAVSGEAIPAGWALDAEGQPTTDAQAALTGTLLAFGGARGANIALMVEVLSAGMAGSNWSLDAPRFESGSESPGSGLFVLAIAPDLVDPEFSVRLAAHLERLSAGYGLHVPGLARTEAAGRARREGIAVAADLVDTLRSWAAQSPP